MRSSKDRRRWRGDIDSVIELVEPNPKQHGSKCYERYENYRNGMTVRQYINAFAEYPRPSDAWIDLTWDEARQYIRIHSPGTPITTP
ncbi:MAG: hypothetical protein JOY54_17990 [Acidobacteriaceae bacterium]|nr:hypothetical protein [Acidobacteriaceae bacterium]